MAERACSKCGLIKTLTDFPARKDAPDGLNKQCRECRKGRRRLTPQAGNKYMKYNRWWRDDHKKKWNAQKRRYGKRTREDAVNARDYWTLNDLRRITAPEHPCDRDLAKELGRSVAAIQVMRAKSKQIALSVNCC